MTSKKNSNISHKNLSVWNEEQQKEMLGEDNRNYTRMVLGHEPTDEELVWHYINNGGAEDFSKRHGDE